MSSTEGDLLILNVVGGNLKDVEILVETFEDRDLKNYKDINGKTPLMYAIEHGKREIIEYLLRSGANTKIIGSDPVNGVVDALYYEDTWNKSHPDPKDKMNYIRNIGNVLDGVFDNSDSGSGRRGGLASMSDLTDRNDYGETSRSSSVFNERGGKKEKIKEKVQLEK